MSSSGNIPPDIAEYINSEMARLNYTEKLRFALASLDEKFPLPIRRTGQIETPFSSLDLYVQGEKESERCSIPTFAVALWFSIRGFNLRKDGNDFYCDANNSDIKINLNLFGPLSEINKTF